MCISHVVVFQKISELYEDMLLLVNKLPDE